MQPNLSTLRRSTANTPLKEVLCSPEDAAAAAAEASPPEAAAAAAAAWELQYLW